MNPIFHDSIGKGIEVYIDDIVVNSIDINQHLANLEQALQKVRFHGWRSNQLNAYLEYQLEIS